MFMIHTNRCELTNLQSNDWQLVKKLYTNIQVRRFLGGVVDLHNVNLKFRNMLESNTPSKYWVIRVKNNSSTDGIGIISLDRHYNNIDIEVSYQLLPEWWNKGYGTEVVKAVVDYALTVLGCPRVIAETQIANTASCRLLESIGMHLEQTLERFQAQQGIFST
jgi:[ribosomal protein S5]-alanine N-acetyltransferase